MCPDPGAVSSSIGDLVVKIWASEVEGPVYASNESRNITQKLCKKLSKKNNMFLIGFVYLDMLFYVSMRVAACIKMYDSIDICIAYRC